MSESPSAAVTGELGAKKIAGTLPKLLIVWNSIPHRGAGADLLMRRMFQDYPCEKLWALTTRYAAETFPARGGAISRKRLFTAPDIEIHRRILWQFSRFLSWLLLPIVVWRGARLVKRLGIEAIFAVPWHQFFVAAYLISRITRRPLYIYLMDDTEGGDSNFSIRSPLYSYFMPRIIRAARRAWCVSEGMRDSIGARFGNQCSGEERLLLLPTAELAEFRSYSNPDSIPAGDPLRIIYTGAIYGMQLDALQRLIRVLDAGLGPSSAVSRIALTLYTSASAEYMGKIGLALGSNARLDRVEHREMPQTLATADILFLPMSFDPRMKHMVSTSIPSKISEYLASGVPILAHGPPYCSAVRYCREFDCGLVVDHPDDAALHEALIRLATDTQLRRKLSANALDAAKKNHDAPKVIAKFLEELGESWR